jgi:hypothetical protein
MPALASFGMRAFLPLWHAEAQDAPRAIPVKLVFVEDRRCPAACAHQRLLDAFARGERAEIVALLRTPAGRTQSADGERVVDGPERAAEPRRERSP